MTISAKACEELIRLMDMSLILEKLVLAISRFVSSRGCGYGDGVCFFSRRESTMPNKISTRVSISLSVGSLRIVSRFLIGWHASFRLIISPCLYWSEVMKFFASMIIRFFVSGWGRYR